MAEPTPILNLPLEILELIVFGGILSYPDVVNLQFSCKTLHSMLHGNDHIWMTRFLERWPKCVPKGKQKMVRNYRIVYILRESWEKKIGDVVHSTIGLLFHKDETPDCILPAVFKDVQLYEKDFTSECVIDALVDRCSPRQDPLLSEQYYVLKLLPRLRSQCLKKWWQTVGLVSLEEGIWFVGELLAPDEDYRSLDKDKLFTELVDKVIVNIGATNGQLADKLYSCDSSTSYLYATSRAGPHTWTTEENSIIMTEVVSTVKQHFFSGKEDMGTDLKGTLQQVMSDENAVPSRVLVAIIIVCVARRLRVFCEIMVLPLPNQGFTFKFRGNDGSQPNWAWTYLAPNMTLSSEAPHWTNSIQGYSTNNEVLSHYAELAVPNNRSVYIVEAKYLLNPDNWSYTKQLISIYIRGVINVERAKELMKLVDYEGRKQGDNYVVDSALPLCYTVEDELKLPTNVPIRKRSDPRNSQVIHSVGMIMTHVRYEYSCVITGWTDDCNEGEHWIDQMGVDQLPHGRYQPFYHVLVNDGSNRYAAQENLRPHDSPIAIYHHSLGQYFISFEQTHYVMNHALARLYPDDTDFTIDAARQRYPTNNQLTSSD